MRGCAFANWPGKIAAGQRIKEPLHVIDWYPTLLKLAGGKLEQKLPIDGKDVWPLLTSQAKSPREAILCVQSPQNAAVRVGDWKLIRRGDPEEEPAGKKKKAAGDRVELFNLAKDLGETSNLAKDEPQRVAELTAVWQKFMQDAVPPAARD